jgi:hypothetical protein
VYLKNINPQTGRSFIICEILFSVAYHFSLWQRPIGSLKESSNPYWQSKKNSSVECSIAIKHFFFCCFACYLPSFLPRLLFFPTPLVLIHFCHFCLHYLSVHVSFHTF